MQERGGRYPLSSSGADRVALLPLHAGLVREQDEIYND